MTLDDRRQGFAAAIAVLVAEFDAYLDRSGADRKVSSSGCESHGKSQADAHIKGLLAPGGQIVLADLYPAASAWHRSRRILHRLVPLRLRLPAMAVLRLGASLSRRGRPWFSPRSGRRETHAMPLDANYRRDLDRDRTVQRGACADGCSEL